MGYEKGAKREFRIRKIDLFRSSRRSTRCARGRRARRSGTSTRPTSKISLVRVVQLDEGIRLPSRPDRQTIEDRGDRRDWQVGIEARHIIRHEDGTYRTLFPIETERLNMFDDWTRIDGIPDSKRGFMMGNALVVGIIERS